MAEVQLTITGGKEMVRKINRFIGSGGLDLSDSLQDSGEYLTKLFSGEVFASRGRIIGEPWAPLNDAYAVFKARRFPGRPPLVQSGEMMRSFRFQESKRSLSLWNDADHFEYHQEGHGVPQRVMMKIDEARALRVGEFIADDLEGQLMRSGLI